VSAGHDLVVERLIGVDADVNAMTSGGQTPLHYAASALRECSYVQAGHLLLLAKVL
jgi:ankyrin repeat protein